jgi:hypothetical protein
MVAITPPRVVPRNVRLISVESPAFYVQPCQGEQQTRAKAQNSKHDGFRFECLDAASAHDEDGAVVNFEQLRLVLGGKLRVSENCLAFAEKLRYQFPAFLLPAPIG